MVTYPPMLRYILYSALLWSAGCAADSPAFPASGPEAPPFALKNFYKGVSWVAGRSPLSSDALAEARALGITWIAQTPFGWMENQYTPFIRLNPNAFLWGEADEGLRTTTRQAHALGMKVMLKPHLWLTRPVDEGWIGEIDFPTEAAWREWESAYRVFILHYARLAEEEHIAVLAVATELSNPVRARPAFWKGLIGEIRQVYSGELTYAANWYRDFDETGLWADLDYIGINAYFPLTEKHNPTVDEIMEGWKPVVERIERIVAFYRKPVLFTEAGYKNIRGTTIRPWEWPRRDDSPQIDNAEQVNAYEALFRTFGPLPWFRGVFIWKWYPVRTRISADRVEFSPQNKEAEQVLTRWYTFE